MFDENGIASGASSNSVGLFNVQLSKKQNPLSRFAQASLTHFLREVEALKVPHRKGIDRIGCDAAQALMACDYPDAFFEATLKGVRLSQCGIINPQTLCATRLNHCKIHFVKSRVSKVISTNGIHTLFSNDGKSLGDFDHVVFTTGHQIDLNLDVPVQSVRGQTILIHPTESSKKINWARVEDGYLTPVAPEITGHGFQVIGATYQAKTVLPDQEKIDSENLLAEATRKWEEFSELSPSHLVKAKAGMRASTPDKLPLIGPLCDAHYLSTHYFSALKGASVKNLPALEVKPGLWILMGLGSRGITFSSLGSEILASLMTGQSLPIEDSIFAHLHPVRFPVRNLRKN